MITRIPIVASRPISGQWRYKEVLQLVPAAADDPKPPHALGDYGGTLIVQWDERIATDRPDDFWAQDLRERDRLALLESAIDSKDGSQKEWLNAVRQHVKLFSRRRSIETEALRLLQTLAAASFRSPAVHTKGWYLDPQTNQPIYAQQTAPSFNKENWGEFWAGQTPAIQIEAASKHFARYNTDSAKSSVTLPDNLQSNLDKYFALSKPRRVTFLHACELFVSAQSVWMTSRSLSLVSNVFAIDALCHADEPEPERCEVCQNLLSDEKCSKCGGPRFGLTRRFNKFIEQFISDESELRIARRLFGVRSDIAHRGLLLRDDLSDPGYNLGGRDDQDGLERHVTFIVRKVLLGWLSQS